MVGIRAGVLDDQSILNEKPPQIEVYVEKRPKWMGKVEGAVQLNGKYEIVEQVSPVNHRVEVEAC